MWNIQNEGQELHILKLKKIANQCLIQSIRQSFKLGKHITKYS